MEGIYFFLSKWYCNNKYDWNQQELTLVKHGLRLWSQKWMHVLSHIVYLYCNPNLNVIININSINGFIVTLYYETETVAFDTMHNELNYFQQTVYKCITY